MNFQSKKSTWPRQAAIVVSDSPNVHMLLRELLRSYAWTVTESTPSVEKAVSLVKTGQAHLIIVDDSLPNPAVRLVRYLQSDPVTICTPVLTFLLESHRGETTALQRIATQLQIVEKPLTPSKFVPGFVSLVKNWEKEPLVSLRRANYQFISGNEAQGVRMLAKLSEIDSLRHVCAQSLAQHLHNAGKVKEAETILLAALKKNPRELGTVIGLSDLYMHVGMPKLAYRLLMGARLAFGQSLAVIPDMIQAALQMGSIAEAIECLTLLHKAGHNDDETTSFLARLLFAEGREAEAEKVLNNNRASFKKIQSGWIAAEQQPMNVAG